MKSGPLISNSRKRTAAMASLPNRAFPEKDGARHGQSRERLKVCRLRDATRADDDADHQWWKDRVPPGWTLAASIEGIAMNTPIITIAHVAPSDRMLAIETAMERVASMLLNEDLPELRGTGAITDEMQALAFSVRRLRTFLTKQTLRVQVMEQAQRLPSRRERAVRVEFPR